MSRILPAAFALLALVLIDSSAGGGMPSVTEVGKARAGTRLVIFWIDSLAARDMVHPERMSRLRSHLARSLHGPVRQCADAMSVPCFTAMQTGVDRFSLFSVLRNFGGASGLPEASILSELQRRGRRVGIASDSMVGAAARGADWVQIFEEGSDPERIDVALDALETERLDVLIVQLTSADEVSHREGARGPAYTSALNRLDLAVDQARARLRPTDHVVVLGDHGHTEDGRHFAGLDVPTYAVFSGPVFARAGRHAMAITDVGALWARVFGLRFGEVPWIDAYASGAEIRSSDALPPPPSAGGGLPAWAMAAVLLLALLASLPWSRALRAPGALAGLGLLWVAAFFLGGLYPRIRPLVYWRSDLFDLGLAVAAGLLGLALLAPAARSLELRFGRGHRRWPVLFVAGTLLLALPTVYAHGGLRLTLAAASLVLLVAIAAALRRRAWARAAWTAGLLVTAYLIWHPEVLNFAVRGFPWLRRIFGSQVGSAAVVLTACSVLLARGAQGRRGLWLLGGALGLGLALAGPSLPPRLFIAPCVLVLPAGLAALRWRSLEPLALGVMIPAFAFFWRFDAVALAPAAVALLLWPLWARARLVSSRGAPDTVAERAVALLILVWLSLWATSGTRAGGLDFNYFFTWLSPEDEVERTWALNGLCSVGKYFGAPLLGLLLAKRVAPVAVSEALGGAWALLRLKLTVCLLMLAGFVAFGGAGPFITGDVYQEGGLWFLSALLVAAWPLSASQPVPELAPARAGPSA